MWYSIVTSCKHVEILHGTNRHDLVHFPNDDDELLQNCWNPFRGHMPCGHANFMATRNRESRASLIVWGSSHANIQNIL